MPDLCGFETYIGPWRGYESPRVQGNVWSEGFDYASGFGDEIVSGYVGHSGAPGQDDPQCAKLMRILEAAPVTEGDVTQYGIALKILATAEPFPGSLGEAQSVLELPVTLAAKLVVQTLTPCTEDPPGSCMESVSEDQDFPVQLHCQSESVLKRTPPQGDATSPSNVADLYAMAFPDRCAFAVTGATFKLASGENVRASVSGFAENASDGPRLRILHIAPTP